MTGRPKTPPDGPAPPPEQAAAEERTPREPDPVRRLLAVMARLRGGQGCPWDREQTHRSLLPYLVEEAFEFIEAVEDAAGADALREELGDVLLQVVFHARIGAERGAFTFEDVAAALADKLVARHPHVFGGEPLGSAEAVSRVWDERKRRERSSALDGVPVGLPALARAGKVAARAARAGFEWRHREEIFAKVREELDEVRAAARADNGAPDLDALEDEFGDLLFAQVQIARWLGIDPEAALRRAVRKFSARFRRMEQALRDRGLEPGAQSAEQWWALWQDAKAHEP